MKKNQKRKSGQEQESSSDSSTVPTPPLAWEEHSQSLGTIISSNSLPLVVRCDTQYLSSMEHNFDLSQPLLLHTKRRVRKVLASCVLHVQHDTGTRLREVGDLFLIPEDYKGWFAVLGHPEKVKSEKVVVPHFRQVAQLALSKCESFLIGGNEPIKAIQMPVTPGSGTQLRLVYPGEVLRMGKLYVGESTVMVKKSSLFRGKKMVKKEEKFLLCTDDNDHELYLPVHSRGTFYVLSTENNGTPKIPIMRLKDICVHHRFPCLVRLLLGRVPATPCSFTGTLVLREAQLESSVIGCTILNLRNILLDLPLDTDLKFYVATSTPQLESSRAYIRALALCQEKISTYMRNIKVAYYMNNEGDGAVCEPPRDMRESVTISGSKDSGYTRPARHRPSVEDKQELFCIPETASPESPKPQKCKKSSSDNPTPPSPAVLKMDDTFNLPAQMESLPVKSYKPSNIKCGCLPPVVTQVQDTLANGYHIPIDHDETQVKQSESSKTKPSTSLSETPPPTPHKVRKDKHLSHKHSNESLYTQVWNGEPASEPRAVDKASTLQVRRMDSTRGMHMLSGFAFADTYLKMQVFKGDASASTLADGSFPPPLPPVGTATDEPNHADEDIYKVPSSLPVTGKTPCKQPWAESQSYMIMSNLAKMKTEEVKQLDQKVPTLPPKRPDSDTTTVSHHIVFENGSWIFSDTSGSSMPSCEFASRWLSSQSSSPEQPDSVYEHMHRPKFTYYEGYDPNKAPVPEDCGNLASYDQSGNQADMEQDYCIEESEAVYENINNLRLYQERLFVSNSANDDADTTEDCILDKTANPPTMLGYIRPPLPHPVLKIPPPVPKKPSSEKLDVVACQPGCSESSPSFPPKFCRIIDSATSNYIHPCPNKLMADDYVQCDNTIFKSPAGTNLRSNPSDVFQPNFEDDLPLGATFADFQSPMSDSGCALESEVGVMQRENRKVSSLSVGDLAGALEGMGLTKHTVNILRQQKVDGKLLSSLNEDELMEILPDIKKLDIKKIQMFVSIGWRPRE